MSSSVAKEITFTHVCKILEEIRLANSQAQKEKKLEEFYKEYKKKGDEIKSNNSSADTSFFPILRILLPQCDRERSAYGLNKFGLKQMLMKILGLPKNSDSLKKLGSEEYDFADTAFSLLQKHFYNSKNLSISEVHDYLDLIAQKQTGNQVENTFLKLFQQTSPQEQKWIIRIILKKMGLGLREMKILNMFHPNASVLLNNTNSLLSVCDALRDPSIIVNNIEIKLFSAVRPMLSRRCDAKELYKTVTGSKTYLVETKFDGERFQLHMENDRFKYFSRRGFDFTKKFGENYSTGLYTPLLKGAFNSNVESVLLDGEMMGWNKQLNEFGSKGMNFDVKHLTETTVHQPCFCVFDIIYLNGEIFTSKNLDERLTILKDIFIPRKGVILHSVVKEVNNKETIVKALNDSMDKKEEGIVFKDPKSLYVPNERNGGWWKMKLEYFSGVMTDLDLIIMGAVYGLGKKIESFVLGVSFPSALDSTPTKYLSLARVSSGLSSEEWTSIRKYLDPHWIKTFADNYEAYGLEFGNTKPDVWIPPKKSCIVQVRATELIKVNKSKSDFKMSYNLRFPRIEKIRFDKAYHECLTATELDELTNTSSPIEKLYNKHLKLEDIEFKLKRTTKFRARFLDTTVQIDEKVSEILKNYKFCVWSGGSDWKVEDIERKIKENGGVVVKNECESTYCIFSSQDNDRLKYYNGSIDVVKLIWLEKVLDCRKVYPYHPEDTIYTTQKTKYRFMRNYDKYGDSYTEKATKYSLDIVFNNIKEKGDYVYPLPNEIDELHRKIKFEKKLTLFEDRIIYFDKYKIVNDSQSYVIYDSTIEELIVRFWNGKVSNTLTPTVNTVIIGSNDILRKAQILSYVSSDAVLNIVDKSYIYEKLRLY